VVDPRFKGLLSTERYRLAQQGGRLHLPRGKSIRGIRADVKALMHISRQFPGDTPLGLVAFLGKLQTACDGSGLNEGTELTLLQYFVTGEVLGVLQRAKDGHASRQLTYKRAVCALLNEYLDGDDLVDHLQSLMQASEETWEDEHYFANRILDANRVLDLVLQESELKSILLKGVGRGVRALGRNFNTQGRTLSKLRKLLAETGAATREARGVKLQAKHKGGTPRSGVGEKREARQARPAASVALPLGAAFAAAAVAVTDDGTKAERAEWAAVLAASGTPVEYGSPGDVRYYRWIAFCTCRAGNNSPRGAGARSCTPVLRGRGAGAAPWCRAPLCPRGRVPSSRTPTAPHVSPVAGPLHLAVAHEAARPRRGSRPGGGGPARFVATWDTGCGSASPSHPRGVTTDAVETQWG